MTTTFSQFTKGQIKSIQRGIIWLDINQSQVDKAITAVNTSKSELRFLGFTVYGGTSPDVTQAVMIQLLNSTKVRAKRGASDTAAEVSWELTEYY